MLPPEGVNVAAPTDTGMLLNSAEEGGCSGEFTVVSHTGRTGRRYTAALLLAVACLLVLVAFPSIPRRAGLPSLKHPRDVIERPELFSGDFGVAGAAGDPCMSSAERSRRWGHDGHKGTAWQIVFPGLMNVRSAKLYLSRMIGMKASCLMVYGRREDNWVRLEGEPGFMMISLNGTVLMEESPVTYKLVPHGSCAEVGRHPIADLATCEAAALALGFPETTAAQTDALGQPEGCYVQGTSVFLSTNHGNVGNMADGARQLVCSSHEEPVADPCSRGRAQETAAKLQGGVSPEAPEEEVLHGAGELKELWTPSPTIENGATPAPVSSSLLCFTVVSFTGHGPELMIAQIENRAGVFSCDTSIVYSVGQKMPLTPGWNTTMINPRVGSTELEQETLTYMEAWDAVLIDDRFHTSNWIVKVAPETVFFADRLRKTLRPFSATQDDGLFFLTCPDNHRSETALLQSLEVFSQQALAVYGKQRHRCKEELPWHTFHENTYIQECLELLEVGSIVDGDMVADAHCKPAPCGDINKVAFFNYDNASSYLECWEKATEVAMAADFMKNVAQT